MDSKKLSSTMGLQFSIGQSVYLVADAAKRQGYIRGVTFRSGGYTYLVCWGYNASETYHYEFELTTPSS